MRIEIRRNEKKEMNFGFGGGYNLPLNDFWKEENKNLSKLLDLLVKKEKEETEK